MSTTTATYESCDDELYSDELLSEPYDLYARLRESEGPVWMSAYGVWAMSRYDQVRAALHDDATYVSGEGVMLNEETNSAVKGILLCSDGEAHAAMRRPLIRPVMPSRIRALAPQIEREADALVERLVARGSFDAVSDLAAHLPVTIISWMVGLPEEGREHMLDWAASTFNCFGPMNQRTQEALPKLGEVIDYVLTRCTKDQLDPEGWGRGLWDAVDRGELSEEQAPMMMIDYMTPSLDTTIFGISNGVWLFARHPEEWARLREDPARIADGVNEVLRLESPIQGFSRKVARDVEVGGVTMEAGSRVILLNGAANRDERKWGPDAATLRVDRAPRDHVAFGFGAHQCVGQALARLEMRAIFSALARRVERLEAGAVERQLNNVLRGFRSIELSVA